MWRKLYNSELVRDSVITTMWSTLSKGVGLLIPFFIAAWFGVTPETDVFFFAYAVIIYLTAVLSVSIEGNIVPFIASIKSQYHEDPALFINRLFSLSVAISVCMTALLIAISRPLFGLITRFPPDSLTLLFRFFIEASPLVTLVVVSSILTGVLNANFRFWVPAVSPAVRAGICILTMFCLKKTLGVHSVVLGYLLGEIARLLFSIYILAKEKLLSLRFDFRADPAFTSFFKVMFFQIVSVIAIGLNPLVDKAMASWLKTGSVSILQYADRLYFIPVTFISSGLMVVVFSRWSDKFYKSMDINTLKGEIGKVAITLGAITVFLTVAFASLSQIVVRLAYARGDFPMASLGEVRSAFLGYLIGLVFYSLGQLAVTAHLVLKNTKTLMKAAFISNVFNVIFNLVFMRFWGVTGIALSTSVAALATFLYLFAALRADCAGRALRNGA